MRDTSLLRLRLHTALACLPLATVGLGCGEAGSPAKPAPTVQSDAGATDKPPPGQPVAPGQPDQPVITTPTPRSPYPARTGQDPFDPDGVEEEGCPNGDWCAPAKVAEKLAVPNASEDLGCVTRLMGSAKPRSKADERLLKGLSQNPMMQGRLRKIATAELRASSGDEEQCCYHWFDYCSGRPLLDDTLASVRAPLQPGATWLTGHVSEDSLGVLPLATRRALASLWLEDARDEHASVAAFARATLELLAVGAPPELLFASQQASLDEIRHAQVCFTIAARYLADAPGVRGTDEAVEPGPLPMVAPRGGGLVALACNTFLEGCVGETIAALAALRASRGCRLPAVQQALAGIADDETRHAELAWATLAFAVQRGGAQVADAVRHLADELARDPADAPTTADALPTELLTAHGRLPALALAETRRDACLEIIAPTLALVLASEAPAPDDLLLS